MPDYQREFIWSEADQARFIESLLLNLPIPLMFLSDTEDGRLEIVDGVQRINTLSAFLNNKLELVDLKKLDEANGFKINDLSPTQVVNQVKVGDDTVPRLYQTWYNPKTREYSDFIVEVQE